MTVRMGRTKWTVVRSAYILTKLTAQFLVYRGVQVVCLCLSLFVSVCVCRSKSLYRLSQGDDVAYCNHYGEEWHVSVTKGFRCIDLRKWLQYVTSSPCYNLYSWLWILSRRSRKDAQHCKHCHIFTPLLPDNQSITVLPKLQRSVFTDG